MAGHSQTTARCLLGGALDWHPTLRGSCVETSSGPGAQLPIATNATGPNLNRNGVLWPESQIAESHRQGPTESG